MTRHKPALIDLVETTERAVFRDPGELGQEREAVVRRRIDPFTGRSARITGKVILTGRGGRGARRVAPPGPQEIRRADPACPFCPGRIGQVTPSFPEELVPGGRLTRGEAHLVPNLYPKGEHSAVVVLGAAHEVEAERLTTRDYRDALELATRYVSLVSGRPEGCRHSAITQNHLPPAGASQHHPHLQVGVDREPSFFARMLRAREEEHRRRSGGSLLGDLADEEERQGTRFIGRTGAVRWFAAFAPRAALELWALVSGDGRLGGLTSADRADIAVGVRASLKYYGEQGKGAFNLALYGDEAGIPGAGTLLRMVSRPSFTASYRSDQSYCEVLLDEPCSGRLPEEVAGEVRDHFTEAEGPY